MALEDGVKLSHIVVAGGLQAAHIGGVQTALAHGGYFINQTPGGSLVRALRAYCSLLTNEFSPESLRAYGRPFGGNVGNGVLTAPWVMTDLNTKIRQIGPQMSPVNPGSLSEDSSSLKLLILLYSCPS